MATKDVLFAKVSRLLDMLIRFFKSKPNRVSTCDGLILRLHHCWAFYMLLVGLFILFLSWLYGGMIECVSRFNSDTQVILTHISVCLSYPFVDEGNGSRRYVTFYRWISWSLLLLAGIFYIPQKVSKSFENTTRRFAKLSEDLSADKHHYDQCEEKMLLERVTQYMAFNLKTHDGLYWKFLGVNVFYLVLDIFTLFYFDNILDGRFIEYGIKANPYNRDRQNFSDYMSQTFPPFVSCELTSKHSLVNKRIERYGCYLTNMEMYEKYFLFIWFWLIALIFVTCCYITFLLSMWLPYVRLSVLRHAKPAYAERRVSEIIGNVAVKCKIGDIYLLYCLKLHLSDARFYELMTHLSDPKLYDKQVQLAENEDEMPRNMQDTLRNRRSNAQTINPNYPEMLSDSDRMPILNEGSRGIPMERFAYTNFGSETDRQTAGERENKK